jgi:hypothetical protein
MYGGFYVLYDEMNETMEREGALKDEGDDGRRRTILKPSGGKQEWR